MSKRSRTDLSKRYQQRYEEREGSFGFMKFPQGTQFYKADEDIHNILIIPYVIKKDTHPLVTKNKAKIGEWDYVLTVDVHQSVGGENETVICPKKNFGKPCPICEEGGELSKTSKRAIYNIINADKPEKGLYILSVSDWLFQREMQEELKASSKGDSLIPFADPENGYIISFRGSKRMGGGVTFTEFKSFKFVRRDKELDDLYEKEKWEEKTISLEECMIIHSYDKIKSMLYDTEDEKEEIEDEKEEVVSRDERREERKRDKNTTCPNGYKFGVDIDIYKECDDCDISEECDKEERKNRKEK